MSKIVVDTLETVDKQNTVQVVDIVNKVGGGNNIGDLDDMNLANPRDGDTIVFNQTTGKWVGAQLEYTAGATAPTQDLKPGKMWYDSANTMLKIYDGSNWVDLASTISADMTVGGISDIDIVNPQNGQALIWNDVSQKWVNVDEGIHDLADAHITNPAEGQVLTYDNASAKWVNKAITFPTFAQLSGVTLASPANNQVLTYENGQWKNKTLPTPPAPTINSNPAGIAGASVVSNVVSMTQAAYNALGSKNASTLYVIKG